jgi:hypothetical protein
MARLVKTTRTLVGNGNGLVMHSNHILADPLHPISQKIKLLTKNRAKTDEDIHESYRLEFTASIYSDQDGDLVMPSDNVNRMFQDTACKVSAITRKIAQAYVFAQTAKLLFEKPPVVATSGDPTTDLVQALWECNTPSFRLIRPVKLQRGASTVMRSRPLFKSWAAEVDFLIDPDQVSFDKLNEVLTLAGQMACLGDWRPKHGTFFVLEAVDDEQRKALKATVKRLKAATFTAPSLVTTS